MRRMSFSMTIDAVRERRKTVTRRRESTWKSLKVADRLLAVDRVMGFKKGESSEILATIEVVDVRVEPLSEITEADVAAEGLHAMWADFPDLGREHFVKAFCDAMGGAPDQLVRRIEFRYVDGDES